MTELSLSGQIKRYRLARGMTQEDLSAHWGVPVMTIRGWERGRSPAQPQMLAVLLDEIAGIN